MAVLALVSPRPKLRSRRSSPPRPVSRRAPRSRPVSAVRDKGASLPGLRRGYNEPLCPLEDTRDLSRYKPLSSYSEKYREFKSLLDDMDAWRRKGQLVVITGDRGYGKTSLQQRCAYHLKCEYDWNGSCEVFVIDLSNDPVDGEDENLLGHFRTRILAEIGQYIGPSDIRLLESRPDASAAFITLGKLLGARGRDSDDGTLKPVSLVVLLPQYPSVKELRQYCSVLQEGMVFIAEEFNPEVIKDMNATFETRDRVFSRRNVGVHVLALGEVTRADAELMINGIEEYVDNCPNLRVPVFMDYVDQLFREEREKGARELANVLDFVVGDALQNGDTAISHNQVYRYFSNSRS